MGEKIWGVVIGFLFSPPGIAISVGIGTGVMLWLTYLTAALQPLAPISYGVVGLLSIASLLSLFFLATNVSERIRTRKPTFIEIEVANSALGVMRTSNVEDQRSFVFEGMVAYLFIFKRAVTPGHIVHIDGLRNSIPKINKQYVTRKGACIFLTEVAPECAFRLTFNKNLEV